MDILSNIPTDLWARIRAELLANGWSNTYEYQGMDAGIDHSEMHLKRANQLLKLVWDPWNEGEITGPPEVLAKLRATYGL